MTATDSQTVKAPAQRLRVAVTLEVTTRVTVEIETDSSATIDEIRDHATKQFDRAGGTDYRNKFSSNTAITLHGIDVKVGQLETLAPRSLADW